MWQHSRGRLTEPRSDHTTQHDTRGTQTSTGTLLTTRQSCRSDSGSWIGDCEITKLLIEVGSTQNQTPPPIVIFEGLASVPHRSSCQERTYNRNSKLRVTREKTPKPFEASGYVSARYRTSYKLSLPAQRRTQLSPS